MTSRRTARRAARRRRRNAAWTGRPAQIYVEATGRRRPPRLVVLLLVLLGLGAGAWYALAERRGSSGAEPPLRVLSGESVLLSAPLERVERWPAGRLRRWIGAIPERRVGRRGFARVTFELDRPELLRRARRTVAGGGGDVRLPERAVSARARVAVVRQALRNNCETAALSMLLAVRGRRVDQLSLQRRLPRSKPLDPRVEAAGTTVWGDPARGFVGRPEGGGPAGGYGVYEGPIGRLARRQGVALRNLSRQGPRSLYRSLLGGRPVMAWVGLSDGPFKSWRTPSGKRVTGNLGEHTVLLTGLDADGVDVNDPLSGRRLRWTRPQFELMWRRLGYRALGA